MRLLALVPARGASKRLPGKNIRPFGGKPLIIWSIDVAKGIQEICDILVSTDEPAIADIARKSAAFVPWLRPSELATDNSTAVDVALHALDWYEREKGTIDGLMLLQPTSPCRSRETVLRGIELFRQHRRPIVGLSPVHAHPMWCFQVDGDVMRPFVEGGGLHMRSQDLPPAYLVNGAFYLIAPEDLRQRRSFYSDTMVPLVIEDRAVSIDIDTEWDWNLSEAALRSQAATFD